MLSAAGAAAVGAAAACGAAAAEGAAAGVGGVSCGEKDFEVSGKSGFIFVVVGNTHVGFRTLQGTRGAERLRRRCGSVLGTLRLRCSCVCAC